MFYLNSQSHASYDTMNSISITYFNLIMDQKYDLHFGVCAKGHICPQKKHTQHTDKSHQDKNLSPQFVYTP